MRALEHELIFFYCQATKSERGQNFNFVSWEEWTKKFRAHMLTIKVPLLSSRVEVHETKKNFIIARFDCVNT